MKVCSQLLTSREEILALTYHWQTPLVTDLGVSSLTPAIGHIVARDDYQASVLPLRDSDARMFDAKASST